MELQRIAQDLGAKYFKVTYKEEKVSFTERSGSAHLKGLGSNAEAFHHAEEKSILQLILPLKIRSPDMLR